MKRNVDLTEDMKFEKRKIMSSWISDFFKLPKYFVTKPESFTPQSKSIMYLGNKNERMFRRSCEEFSLPVGVCDCCGREIKVPWRRGSGGLCINCDKKEDRKGVFSNVR